jgi:hypothetical protein
MEEVISEESEAQPNRASLKKEVRLKWVGLGLGLGNCFLALSARVFSNWQLGILIQSYM